MTGRPFSALGCYSPPPPPPDQLRLLLLTSVTKYTSHPIDNPHINPPQIQNSSHSDVFNDQIHDRLLESKPNFSESFHRNKFRLKTNA